MSKKKLWCFQQAEDGHTFWDTFLHKECDAIAYEGFDIGYTPFNPPKSHSSNNRDKDNG